MEKRINCEYLQTEHDSSESLETRPRRDPTDDVSSRNRRFATEGPEGPRKEIASKVRSTGRRRDKEKKALIEEGGGSALGTEILELDDAETIDRQVPDRLGKFFVASESVSSEEKSISLEMDFLLKDYSDTKLYTLGNECLKNKEAVSFSNSFESASDGKNIFENFFDDCLAGTTVSVRDGSTGKSEGTSPEPGKIPSPRPLGAPRKRKDPGNGGKKVRHVCAYCQKIFKSNGKLNSHVYSHTGERPFDCNNCGKAFSSKFKLVRHLLIHSEVRKFVCQICDRTFLRNDHLKNHYKVHDPQKKMYKCSKRGCVKEYSSVMSHKKHMAYHSVEDGDLKCSICGVKYETKEDILFHLKSHSGSRLFKSQTDKKFKCQFCDRLFLTRKDVTRHLVVHTGERDFLCQFCPQRFGRKDHLVRHIKKSHVGGADVPVKNENSADLSPRSDSRKDRKKCPKKKAPVPAEKTIPDDRVTVSPLGGGGKSKAVSEETKKEGNGNEIRGTADPRRIVITVGGDVETGPAETAGGETGKSAEEIEKSSATRILLRNVPNILIIPNNSIILVGGPGSRNPKKKSRIPPRESENAETKENEKTDFARESPDEIPTEFDYDYEDSQGNGDPFRSSEFPSVFPGEETDAFPNFNAADLADFNPGQFDEAVAEQSLGFDLKPAESLLNLIEPEADRSARRSEDDGDANNNNYNNSSNDDGDGEGNESARTVNENLLSEASRQIRLLETGMHRISSVPSESCKKVGIVKPMTARAVRNPEAERDFFKGIAGGESLNLNDSVLSDDVFKTEGEEESGILRLGTDCAILSSLLNHQPANELANESILRNFLAPENPSVFTCPLPGFSQIFHNSNANSN